MSRHRSQACWEVWVTSFPGMLGGLGRDINCSALCGDRNSVSRQGLGLGQAWVATRVSLCRDRVFPRKDHSCRDRKPSIATGSPRVVLRQGVFLSRPTGQACVRDRVLGARMTDMDTLVNVRTSGGAARVTQPPARTTLATTRGRRDRVIQ